MTVLTSRTKITLSDEEKRILRTGAIVLKQISNLICERGYNDIYTEDEEMDILDDIYESIDVIEDNVSRE